MGSPAIFISHATQDDAFISKNCARPSKARA